MPDETDKSWVFCWAVEEEQAFSALGCSLSPPWPATFLGGLTMQHFFSEYNGHRVWASFRLLQNHGTATSCERTRLGHGRTSKQ